MQRRLEKRENGRIVLVVGKEDSRARSVLERLGDDIGYWEWAKPEDEYTLRVVSPSRSYTPVALNLCYKLANAIAVIERYNKWELLAEEVGREPCLIKIDDEVYQTLEHLKKRVKEVERELDEAQAKQDELKRNIFALQGRIDRQVIAGGMTRGQLRAHLRDGDLEETCASKTLYEMYDDGLI